MAQWKTKPTIRGTAVLFTTSKGCNLAPLETAIITPATGDMPRPICDAYNAVLMALDDTCVTGNDGIVTHDVDMTIENLCALASRAMQHTDVQIIEIMEYKAAANG